MKKLRLHNTKQLKSKKNFRTNTLTELTMKIVDTSCWKDQAPFDHQEEI